MQPMRVEPIFLRKRIDDEIKTAFSTWLDKSKFLKTNIQVNRDLEMGWLAPLQKKHHLLKVIRKTLS